MHTARATWEEGTLRASNDELYAILESVYASMLSSKLKLASVARLPLCSRTLKLKTQANTSLALKVIRYVFANARSS